MYHHVRAERQRALAVGGSEGVIDHQPGALLMSEGSRFFQVDDVHGGVDRRLGIDQPARLQDAVDFVGDPVRVHDVLQDCLHDDAVE